MKTVAIFEVTCPKCGFDHEVKVQPLKCSRCGHAWLPRQPMKDVRQCPNCRSVRWDSPAGPRLLVGAVEPDKKGSAPLVPGPTRLGVIATMGREELEGNIARYMERLATMAPSDPLFDPGQKALTAMRKRLAKIQNGTSI